MRRKTYLIKIWFFHDDTEPPEVIRGKILERFRFLGDSLENVEVIDLEEKEEESKNQGGNR
jgi:hypothetical protein